MSKQRLLIFIFIVIYHRIPGYLQQKINTFSEAIQSKYIPNFPSIIPYPSIPFSITQFQTPPSLAQPSNYPNKI